MRNNAKLDDKFILPAVSTIDCKTIGILLAYCIVNLRLFFPYAVVGACRTYLCVTFFK